MVVSVTSWSPALRLRWGTIPVPFAARRRQRYHAATAPRPAGGRMTALVFGFLAALANAGQALLSKDLTARAPARQLIGVLYAGNALVLLPFAPFVVWTWSAEIIGLHLVSVALMVVTAICVWDLLDHGTASAVDDRHRDEPDRGRLCGRALPSGRDPAPPRRRGDDRGRGRADRAGRRLRQPRSLGQRLADRRCGRRHGHPDRGLAAAWRPGRRARRDVCRSNDPRGGRVPRAVPAPGRRARRHPAAAGALGRRDDSISCS